MSTPVNTNIALIRPRIAVNVGSIVANNAPVQFGCGEGSTLVIVVPSGVTTATDVLECSIDNGGTWFILTATAYTLTGQLTGDTAPIKAQSYNIAGLPGAQFRYGFSANTGLTSAAVWVMVGTAANQ